jgi:S1-C subfamily serine protease
MSAGEWLRLIWQAVTTGLALAFLWVVFQPDTLRGAAPPLPRAPGPVAAPLMSWSAAVQAAAPSVVSVYALRPAAGSSLLGGRSAEPDRSAGSGVVVSVAGHILTNRHVVQGATAIMVELSDGRRAPATLVGEDELTDLAVLQASLDAVPIATIARVDQLQVGDVVLAIGNPYGFSHTVTQGIVSATGRNRVGISMLENFIQTDAAINPGNSGGALVNSRGELVGISTAIVSGGGGADGIGFAIPAPMAIDVMHDLIEVGAVRRSWLGIAAGDLRPEDARRLRLGGRAGVRVDGLYRGGPAEMAGLELGDVVTAIDGVPILDSRSVMEHVSPREPGSRVELEVVRDGIVFLVPTVIEQRPMTSFGS